MDFSNACYPYRGYGRYAPDHSVDRVADLASELKERRGRGNLPAFFFAKMEAVTPVIRTNRMILDPARD